MTILFLRFEWENIFIYKNKNILSFWMDWISPDVRCICDDYGFEYDLFWRLAFELEHTFFASCFYFYFVNFHTTTFIIQNKKHGVILFVNLKKLSKKIKITKNTKMERETCAKHLLAILIRCRASQNAWTKYSRLTGLCSGVCVAECAVVMTDVW